MRSIPSSCLTFWYFTITGSEDVQGILFTPFQSLKSLSLRIRSDTNKKYKQPFDLIIDGRSPTTVRMNLPHDSSSTPSKEDVDIVVEADHISESLEEIYTSIKEDAKSIPKVSTTTFLLTLGVGIPVWMSFLLPMTMIYQLGKSVLNPPTKKRDLTSIHDPSAHPVEAITDYETPNDNTPLEERKYDLVLFGATGFTGKLAAVYLCQQYGAKSDKVKWAIAGRSKEKLDDLKKEISREVGNSDMMNVDVIIADSSNIETLYDVVKDSRSVASTVGPYALYGSPLVECCAKYGTNYVDITGEKEWSRKMIAQWDAVAQKTGAKIISFCGHDSVPWDLTAFKLAEALRRDKNDDIVKVECFDEIRGGGVSGGTIETIINGMDYQSPKYPSDPWMRQRDGTSSMFKTKVTSPFFPQQVRKSIGKLHPAWVSPFLMTVVNGEVVKRSIALRGSGNLNVTYWEGMLSEDFKTAFVNTFGLYIGLTALLNPISGTFLRKFVLPKPGQGPSKRAMEKGYLCVYGVGTGSKGNVAESAMYFPYDVGYRETARILVESGLCLALDRGKLPVQVGGFYTPSTGMGNALLDRLCKSGTLFRCKVLSGTIQSKL